MRRHACVLGFLTVSTVAWSNPTFTRLDPLLGSNNSEAFAVSNTGVVVGHSYSPTQAVRWVNGVVSSLGDFPGGDLTSYAYGISADGLNIVGKVTNSVRTEAYRWTIGTGMLGLGDLNGGSFGSRANAISSNGVWIAGQGSVNAGTTASRFSDAFGPESLGELAGGLFSSIALGISNDGNTAVGWSEDAEGPQAFRWTLGGGMAPLPGLASGPWSKAFAMTPDGSIAVGYAGDNPPDNYLGSIVKWEGNGPPTLLAGALTSGAALCVSADGRLIGGFYGEDTAFYWTPSLGFVGLTTDLAERGVSTGGMRPTIINGVSPSGEYLVGEGIYQGRIRAWVARFDDDFRTFPTTLEVVDGFPGSFFTPGLLQYADNDPVSAFSDETTLRITLEVTGVLPILPSSLEFKTTAYATRAGLSYSIQAYNWDTARFDQVHGRFAPTTRTDVNLTLTNPQPYYSADLGTRWRVTWEPINDEDPAQDSWPVVVDKLNWISTP